MDGFEDLARLWVELARMVDRPAVKLILEQNVSVGRSVTAIVVRYEDHGLDCYFQEGYLEVHACGRSLDESEWQPLVTVHEFDSVEDAVNQSRTIVLNYLGLS